MAGPRVVIAAHFFLIALLFPPSVEPMWKQVLAKKVEGSNKKPSEAPIFIEAVKSLSQCVLLCNNKLDECKSIGYLNNECHIFNKLYAASELKSADGYNYFEPKPVEITVPYFKYFKETATFEEAAEKCKSLDVNGRLACIHDEETNKRIVDIMKTTAQNGGIWIGLRAKTTEGPFVWGDGVEISADKKGYWHNWLPKDPDDYKKDVKDSCVRMLNDKRGDSTWFTKWADTAGCDRMLSYMCEIRHIK